MTGTSTAGGTAAAVTGAGRRRSRGGLMVELVVRRVFQVANLWLLADVLWASSDLAVAWSVRRILFQLVVAAWVLGTVYLWVRSSWQLPLRWYVAPLLWVAVVLIVSTDLPQTVRLHLVGERALSAYQATNPAGPETRRIEAEIGGYEILGVQEVQGVYVFHAVPRNDLILDQGKCGALMHVPRDRLAGWWPAHAGSRSHDLGGDWWLFSFSARGVWCPAVFDSYLRAHPA